MTRLSLLIDVTKCNGCYNCYLACRDEYYGNDYPPYSAAQPLEGHAWMRVEEIERGAYPKPKVDYIPVPCMHCETAPCIEAAPTGAVYRRDDGIVLIDPEKAEGRQSVVDSCPYGAIFWNEASRVPQKCTLCAHRLDEGDAEPRCVEACPTGALVFGDLDDPTSEIARLVAALETETYCPEFGTAPSVVYVGIPKRFLAGEVVRRDRTDECAEGAKVVLEGQGMRRETLSDSYGDFEFEGLERDATYRLTVELAGYATVVREVVTRTDVDLGEVVLEPLS